MKATRLAALGVGLAYASHVGAMVGMAWVLGRKYRGTGHTGALRDHLPAYAYPRRKVDAALREEARHIRDQLVPLQRGAMAQSAAKIVPGDRVVPAGKLVFDCRQVPPAEPVRLHPGPVGQRAP